jgi:pimeloyl-ACP methyl ester carboxylesterase
MLIGVLRGIDQPHQAHRELASHGARSGPFVVYTPGTTGSLLGGSGMKKLTALLSCVVLIGLGAGSVSAGEQSASGAAIAAVDSLDWGRCASKTLRDFHARCAKLSVPLDYDDPSGEQIKVALSRVRHSVPDDEYQGVMLVNPGGPGGSGLILSILGQFIPKGAGDAYDWIGFDPRGVGSSRPALSCIPKYFHGDRPPYVPKTDSLESAWMTRSEKYASACEGAQPDLLPHMTTADAARDMDSIRLALGVDQINYYGFSYGTYLGQVYTTLFPGKMRRAVFDGVVDPRAAWHEANLDQDLGFDRNVHIFFAWLASHNRAYHLGKTEEAVAQLFLETQRALTRHPAGGVVGPAEWNDIFLYSGYSQGLWKPIGKVFSSWVHQHATRRLVNAFRALDAPGYDNGFAVYLAVICTDAPWPDWESYSADVWATHAEAPLFSWNNGWFNAPCMFWQAPSGTPVNVTGDSTPVLIINETLDAPTPYEGALFVRSVFPQSSLVAVIDGVNHANSLAGNKCVDLPIAEFLSTGALPARLPGDGPDVECDPLPPPKPSAKSAAATPVVHERPLPDWLRLWRVAA